jgi:hypothetical protein
MAACPYCGHYNRQGVLYCEECVRMLASSVTINTKQLAPEECITLLRTRSGTSTFAQDSYLVVHIQGAVEPLVLQVISDLIFGRKSRNVNQEPDVDLTPFHALEKGVSHVHTLIEYHEQSLLLTDLDSRNGTYLNGERLTPHNKYILHDGDEIRMGKLTVHTYFHSSQ